MLFKAFGLCFAISPTCQSLNNFQIQKENVNPNSLFNKYGYSNDNSNNNLVESVEIENGANTSIIPKNTNTNGNNTSNNNSVKYDSLLVCQITGFNEARIFKFVTNQFDMIMNYDFYVQNGN